MIKKQINTGLFIRSIAASSTPAGARNKYTAIEEMYREYPQADGWEVIDSHYIAPRTPAEVDAGTYTFALVLGQFEYVAE